MSRNGKNGRYDPAAHKICFQKKFINCLLKLKIENANIWKYLTQLIIGGVNIMSAAPKSVAPAAARG